MRILFLLSIAACANAAPSPTTTTVDELKFAIVGDTRPPSEDDTASYPSEVAGQIWQDVAREAPSFAVGTGDYMFASPQGREQRQQLGLYLRARAAFSGPLYAAMGNHECTGATASNCGDGNRDGKTENFAAFTDMLLAPIGQSLPYYRVRFAASDGAWTAKLVAIACNAWSDAQASWLDTTLAEPTTYTFVVRHESDETLDGTPTPPCVASRAIVDAHAPTLLIVGHTHTYRHRAGSREVIVGNGGAPLTSGGSYGYAIVARDPGGRISVTARDYATGAAIDTFQVE